jgi:integrase
MAYDKTQSRTVEAMAKSDIETMYTTLQRKYKPIYADVWKVGCNLSLRISDLLDLKFSDLDLKNRTLELTEQKTKKTKHIRLNNAVVELVQQRKEKHPSDVYLFQVDCNRAKNKPISRVSVGRVFKECAELLGIDNINTHSMRKSRGKAMFDDGLPVETIAKVLNHSSTSTTLRYLGITKEQILQTYDDYEL